MPPIFRFPAATAVLSLAVLLAACGPGEESATTSAPATDPALDTQAPTAEAEADPASEPGAYARQHLDDYVEVELTADLSGLSDAQRQMLVHLIDAARAMDPLFWQQVWGDPASLMQRIDDPATRRFAEINYGPWDRLNDDVPFVEGVGPRPPGANFYPADMDVAEFEAAALPGKADLYTLVRRDADGALVTVPYHVAFAEGLARAAASLRAAAALAGHEGFREYLELRAKALLDDDYQPSDMAWMDMKTNPIDIVIGPIETYQDQLFGYKAAYEAYVLVKDMEWSKRLERFAKYLPELQQGLPVEAKYKAEMPGTDADLNAYFAVYYAGDANSGAKTIAINLPNDEEVQLAKGSRRLQLENVMQAKFDRILVPIADALIASDQRRHVTFDAFFENTMFHEVAHGLGIKNTIGGAGSVREALKDQASSFEEGKADVLGLYMVTALAKKGELDEAKLMDNYVTFLAGIFRSVRFGASSAHGQANMVRFNFFRDAGAFARDEASGRYRVDFAKMQAAVDALSARILVLQGDGDYAGAQAMTAELGTIDAQLEADLASLAEAKIPVDIVFRQGPDVLGLPAAAGTPPR